MMAVWAILGVFVGAATGLEGGGTIGAVAGTIAGMVELALLGAVFALVRGKPRESLVGAGAGLLVGLTVGMAGQRDSIILVSNFGLIYGAIVGATLRSYLRLLSLPIVILGRILRRHRRPEVIVLGYDGQVASVTSLPSHGRAGAPTVPHSVGRRVTHERVT
jgi:hypothetical protein